jgi:hypothetical protein
VLKAIMATNASELRPAKSFDMESSFAEEDEIIRQADRRCNPIG